MRHARVRAPRVRYETCIYENVYLAMPPSKAKRMSIPLVAGLIALVAIVVFALAALGFYTRLERERDASPLQLSYDRAEDQQPDVSPDAKRGVFGANAGARPTIWSM